MTILAHLTDLHLLEDEHALRAPALRARLSFLSFGRPLDAAGRRRRVARALDEARSSGAEHVLVTGDLTEDGTMAEFEVLAALLSASGIPPARITLVPGNHDLYDDPNGWDRALAGPLAPWAKTSRVGALIELREADVLALSTARHQHFTRSAGWLDDAQLATVASRALDGRRRRRPLVVAQHHPPNARWFAPMQWIDGLAEHAKVAALLAEHANVAVVHGHSHRRADRRTCPETPPRIFCAEAVVESSAPVRFYEACSSGLFALDRGPDQAAFVGVLAPA